MNVKVNYEAPTLRTYRAVLEENLAQTVAVSVEPRLIDWEDGGTIGDAPADGGEIYLFY